MEKPLIRPMMPVLLLLISLMVGLDIVVDRLGGHSWISTLAHIGFGSLIILAAHLVLNRAAVSRRKAEALMRQTQEELEARVQGRTADLKLVNESLRTEITERVQADIERERLMAQIEAARLRAESLVTELHLANNMLVTLIDTLPAGMIIIDVEGRIVLANSHARALMKTALAGDYYGLRDELSLRRRDGEVIGQDDLPLVRAIQHGEITPGLEVECCLEDGGCVDLLIAASPVRDETGKIVYAVKIMLDITGLKTMEKALRASEEKYRAQFDAFSEPTTVWDRGGRLLMQNLVSASNLHGRREDFIGKTIFEVFGAGAEEYLERIQRVIDTGVTEYQEDIVSLPKGKRSFWTCIQRIQNPDGQVAAQILSYDITERRQNEDALRVSEEKFSTVFHFSPNPVGIVRVSNGVLLEVNQAFSNVSGWSRPELMGRNWKDTGLIPTQQDQEAIMRQFLEKGSVRDCEVQSTDRDGNLLVLLLSLIPITIRDEACVLIIAHDITERKSAEEMLRQTQVELERGNQERLVLQERQRLARELHDSVSQALYGISLGAHTALTLFDTDRTKVLDAINYILGLAQAGLTEMRALIFELRPESLKLEGLVTAIGKHTAALRARHGIEVNFNACPEPEVPYKFKEALYRIAQEAMQNALKHARPSRLEIDLCSDSDGIRLDICDDGVGFDPDAAYPGHLGLQSMRERAADLQGSCEITSQIHQGTQVHIHIPAHRIGEKSTV
jgi:PAS domain S-box-containing protein